MVGESSVPQSEAEVVPDTPLPSGEESAWDVVTDKEQVDPDLAVKEEEAINQLADDLSQVVNLDEPDFSTDPPPQDPLPPNSSEPKEPDVFSDKAVEPPPPADQPAAATDTPSPPASATPKPGQKTLGLSALQPLEALEATEGEGAQPMGPPPKPQSKAAAVNKVSQRRRKFLIETGAPTSGDEQHPPKLGDFLLGAKSKAAAKRSASVSAKKRKVVRCQSHERSRSHGRNANEITGGPIRPLSPQRKKPQDQISGGPIGPLSPQRKKPQSVLAQAEKAETWKDRKHRFLQETYDALCRSWDADSMAWVNLHVAAYFYEFTRVTHPRQLAACSLRSSSNETHRWSCWSCQLFPEEAQAAGFSPSKSCWVSDTKQLYHWYQTHAKASHWTWIHEAEELCISHAELMTFLLGCDISQWPLPWTQFALGAIPRELPRKASGHNVYVFGAPYYRKLTSLKAPSEQYWQAVVEVKQNSNRPVSPPAPPKTDLTALGWTNPVEAYGPCATDELTFLLSPFKTVKEYSAARIAWHNDQCGVEQVTDFLLFVEQHTFFLMYMKLVATLALSMPENLTGSMREASLGQVAVCTPQLKEAFHQGMQKVKIPTRLGSYVEDIVKYMNDVMDIAIPIMGSSIPRPPAPPGVFPPDGPSASTPAMPSTSATAASSTSRPQCKPAPRTTRRILDELD